MRFTVRDAMLVVTVLCIYGGFRNFVIDYGTQYHFRGSVLFPVLALAYLRLRQQKTVAFAHALTTGGIAALVPYSVLATEVVIASSAFYPEYTGAFVEGAALGAVLNIGIGCAFGILFWFAERILRTARGSRFLAQWYSRSH